MNYLGDFAVGQEVYIWFNTFDSNDPSASVTMTTFIDTDVHIHKDDSLVQRNDAAGVAVDVDVDGIAGIHKITIQTADNTVADFYEAGHDYAIRIEGATVDGALINPVVATFSIANRRVAGEMCRSSIATLASQTSFTLTSGEASAQDDAYNFCTVIITDQITRIQKAIGFISDYTGATRTITLIAAPLASGFTMAVGDSVEILATSAFANMAAWNEVPLDTTNPLPNAAADAAGGVPISDAGGLDLDAQKVNIDDIETDTNELQVDWVNGGRLDLLLDAIPTTAMRGTDSAALASEVTATRMSELDDSAGKLVAVADLIKTAADAIKLETDKLTLGDAGAGVAGSLIEELEDIIALLPAALVGGRMDSDIGAKTGNVPLSAQEKLDVNTEVDGALDTTITLPGQTAPPLTPTLREGIAWLYKVFRNRKTQTATVWSLMADDETTVDAKATISDDTTTAIKQEIVTGP